MDYDILLKFLTALSIGAIIGTVKEKEKTVKRNFGGFRTFILVALTGAFSYFLSDLTGLNWLFPVLFIGIVVLTGLSYVFMARTGRIGIKTELAIFLTYILGYVAMTEYATMAIILSAIIVVIIESDKFVHKFIANTNLEEWMATLRFGAIAFIIFPILPDKFIDPLQVINPSKIWLLVVLISGIGFIGYFLIKIMGSKRGIMVNGVLGGIVSSTATTLSLSSQSHKLPSSSGPLVLSTTIASLIMFLRVLIILIIISPWLFVESVGYILFLFLIMGLAALVECRDAIKNYRMADASKVEIAKESPFSFYPALKLAVIFTLIQVAANLTLNFIGNKGIYIMSFFSSLVDIDPIVISLSTIFKNENVDKYVIVIAILIAVTVNTGLKGLIAYFNGSKEFGTKILKVFGFTFFVGVVLILGLMLTFHKTLI